jgi:hypothetical protein
MHQIISEYPVTDRASFADFAEALAGYLDQDPEEWENRSLKDFLEAVGRYAADIHGYYANMNIPIDADKPGWQVFADILKGATMYE